MKSFLLLLLLLCPQAFADKVICSDDKRSVSVTFTYPFPGGLWEEAFSPRWSYGLEAHIVYIKGGTFASPASVKGIAFAGSLMYHPFRSRGPIARGALGVPIMNVQNDAGRQSVVSVLASLQVGWQWPIRKWGIFRPLAGVYYIPSATIESVLGSSPFFASAGLEIGFRF